jgi:hypothetical protein
MDVSVVAGLVFTGECIQLDYRRLASPYTPYYPDLDDARKLARAPHALVEVPTQSVPMRAVLKGAPGARLKEALRPAARALRYGAAVLRRRAGIDQAAQVPISPFGVRAKQDFILDFGLRRPLWQWLRAVDLVLARAIKSGEPSFLVFENHTKDLTTPEDFERITRIVAHIQERYGDAATFVQLKDMAKNRDRIQPRCAHD